MHLNKGRLADMLAQCDADEGHIPCHETIYTEGAEPAICFGFFECNVAERSLALRYGWATDTIVMVDPPHTTREDFLGH
jgi:hypothetical protein